MNELHEVTTSTPTGFGLAGVILTIEIILWGVAVAVLAWVAG